jgi:hypothetical protein
MKLKTLTTIITVIVIFLALSIFGWVKNANLKKVTAQKAKLEVQFANLQKEKDAVDYELSIKQTENALLNGEKIALESKLQDYKDKTDKIIKDHEKTIAELKNIPIDTVYQYVYAYYVPLSSEVPKYPFTESQVRKIHLAIFENQYLDNRLNLAVESMKKCNQLNAKNDEIITNLEGQNKDLTDKNTLSEGQVVNLQDQLKLSNKQVGKQKRKTFLYKTTTVIAGTLAVIFAFN